MVWVVPLEPLWYIVHCPLSVSDDAVVVVSFHEYACDVPESHSLPMQCAGHAEIVDRGGDAVGDGLGGGVVIEVVIVGVAVAVAGRIKKPDPRDPFRNPGIMSYFEYVGTVWPLFEIR